MAIYRTPKAQYDAVQERLKTQQPRFEESIANIELATTEHDDIVLAYRGRRFLVPPVPYKQGLWLLALEQELRRMHALQATKENILHTMHIVLEMVTIFHKLVRPLTLFDRIVWPWRANPFLHAEMQEIQALKSFFCTSRTNLTISAIVAIRAPRFVSWTWPMRKPHLPIGIHAGWHRQETLAAGDTTDWEPSV
jgi:hypothetical protein